MTVRIRSMQIGFDNDFGYGDNDIFFKKEPRVRVKLDLDADQAFLDRLRDFIDRDGRHEPEPVPQLPSPTKQLPPHEHIIEGTFDDDD